MSPVSRSVSRPVSRSILAGQSNTLASIIKSLFANNEQGFAYDPNDLTTMFQDSVGTVPVTGAGQAVGLMLDKSRGLAREATNFWTGSVTKIDANWANNGDGTFISNGGSGGIGLTSTSMKTGRFYEWTFEVTSHTSGAVRPQNGSGLNYQYASSVGTHIQKALCSDSSLYFYSNAFNGTIRPISVRELAGNHAYQTTSAARPILQQTPILSGELVVNGDFSNGTTGWSVQNGTVAVVNGAARVTATSAAQPQIVLPLGFLAGKAVEISVNFMNRTGGTGVFIGVYSIASGVISSITSLATNGVVKIKAVIPLGFDGGLYCRLNGPTSGSYVDFDNISIKEITGYRTDQNYLAFDGVDDKLITNLPAQLTGCTAIRSVPNVGTQILTNQTIPTPYNDNTDHCGLIVINRALTATETSQITKLFNKAAGV